MSSGGYRPGAAGQLRATVDIQATAPLRNLPNSASFEFRVGEPVFTAGKPDAQGLGAGKALRRLLPSPSGGEDFPASGRG